MGREGQRGPKVVGPREHRVDTHSQGYRSEWGSAKLNTYFFSLPFFSESPLPKSQWVLEEGLCADSSWGGNTSLISRAYGRLGFKLFCNAHVPQHQAHSPICRTAGFLLNSAGSCGW